MSRRPSASLLLATTAPRLDVDAAATASRVPRRAAAGPSLPGPRRPPTPARFYLGLATLVLGLAALSLLAPSTPSYDPWSWTLWAGEIIHGHLVITDTGTSWKPLPMLFTIPFALLGRSAAPDLWLVVARAGAIAAVLMAFRIAHRLVRELGETDEIRAPKEISRPGGREGVGRSARGRLAVQAPAILAGLIALVGLGFAARGAYITSNGLGYSEALAAALLLVAVECHLDGRHRATFVVGFLVALDRPEIWLFWVPYGLWLGRRDPASRAWIALAFLAQPVVWFLPVYLGSGHLGSSVTRATHPRSNSLAFASDPFTAELSRAAWPTMMLRCKIMAGLMVLALPVAWSRRRRAAAAPDRASRAPGGAVSGHALTVAALLGLGGLAWFVVIAAMTQVGFSGNDRYLVLGAALVDVCAAVGFGWLALALARAWTSAAARRSARGAGSRRGGIPAAGMGRGRAALAGTALAAAVFALVPGWIANQDFVSLPKVHRALLYQAHLREFLPHAIALAGGRRRLLACGSVMSEGFQVPMVAYALDVPTTRVLAPPTSRATAGPAPNVILQTRDTQSARELPALRDWRPARYTHLGRVGPWRTYTHCSTGS